MIADYFLVRRARLRVEDLYRRDGAYEYRNGVNPRAVAALVLGIAVALLGLALPPLRWLYDYAWFAGFGVSATVYVMLMQRAAASGARNPAWEGKDDRRSYTLSPVSFYINGVWERPAGRSSGDRNQPRHRRRAGRGSLRRGGGRRPRRPRRPRAFLTWRDVPVVDRVQPLYRYKDAARKARGRSRRHADQRKRQDRRRRQLPRCAAPFRWWRWLAACPA